MSVRVMSLVWDLDLPAFEKLVLLALADCANDEGLAWPSIATLRRKTNAGERTVQRSLRALETSGQLKRVEVPGKGCKYFLSPRQSGTPATKAPAPEKAQTPATVAPNPSGTVTSLAKAKPKRVSEVDLPDWMPRDKFEAYLEMRVQMKKRPTAKALKLLIAQLERWRSAGHDPGVILDNSTMNNWTGIFEPRRPANDRHHDKPTTRDLGMRVAARFASGSGIPDDRVPRLGSSGGHG